MSTANAADPLGYDVDIDLDLQPDARACSGLRLVQNAILHRLMANTLPCIGAPGGVLDYGIDVREWVQEATTPARAAAKGPLVALVIARDPRIDAGSITAVVAIAPPGTTFTDGSSVDLTITIGARTTTALPIALVVGVSSVTVDLLAQGK